VPAAFYKPDGDGFVATEATRGPWDPDAQHAGPPAALIGRAVEQLDGGRMTEGDGASAQVGRITYEILRSVPIARVEVGARVIRRGRRVELVEAELTDGAETLIRARGWRLRSDEVNFETPARFGPVPPGPDRAEPRRFFETGQDVGYHTAMDYRFVQGAFTESGRRRSGCG
jgi:Acyl-CoA thioesterase N-terminal domain